ncbi:hypothetical protein IPU70_02420 [Achromobacter sp. SD115]|uniref:hypothetical protein n=1 Tax=Achromobacter sp. SD115 TaxID=2782011 RepID=UPI001A972D46|nr:hypothetical protein [Achromobacter sp. SD115]MBO1012388.1 hypothetical protein [Achromobacter sp. SD115]
MWDLPFAGAALREHDSRLGMIIIFNMGTLANGDLLRCLASELQAAPICSVAYRIGAITGLGFLK